MSERADDGRGVDAPDAAEIPFVLDQHGMPVGLPVADWQGARWPGGEPLEGVHCRLERLVSRHADELFDAYARKADARDWTYLPYGPFASPGTFRDWIEGCAAGSDPQFRAIVPSGSVLAQGIASWLRIEPASGAIEVGHIHFAPMLQRSAAATEAMFLMMREVFALGYRRYEWKCDALNARSRRAALRLGFTFEGVFRQATLYKGRNRDTAWFSIVDREWPRLEAAFERWLDPCNFDAGGHQRRALETFR